MIKSKYIFLFSLFLVVLCVFFLNAPNKKTIEIYLKNFENQKFAIHIYDGGQVKGSYTDSLLQNEQIQILKSKLGDVLSHSGTLDFNSYTPSIKINCSDFFINFQKNKTIINRNIRNTNQWIQYSRRPIDHDIKTSKYLEEIYHKNKNPIHENNE